VVNLKTLKFLNLNKKQIKQVEKDKMHTQELTDEGFRVIRLWENEINKMTVDQFKEKLIEC
jgi:G:T-mismatch repair DNA endonuclease (very short patch repair protein)